MTVNENSKPLLTVKGLKQYFKVSNNYTVHAVENVSFQIYPGETYGLVGESGSGKSTIGRSIIRLYDPTAGEINFNGMDISGRINKANSQALRTQMQMIFQDPMASLNPRKKVRDIIGEGLDIHHMYKTRAEREEKIKNILAKVGLAPEHAGRYPHQFSGGQRQRVGIGIGEDTCLRHFIGSDVCILCRHHCRAFRVVHRPADAELCGKLRAGDICVCFGFAGGTGLFQLFP